MKFTMVNVYCIDECITLYLFIYIFLLCKFQAQNNISNHNKPFSMKTKEIYFELKI